MCEVGLRKVQCDDCEWRGQEQDLQRITSFEGRVDAGGVVPAGQCPECGALAYLIVPEETLRDSDISLLIIALQIAAEKFKADGIAAPGLEAQFALQAKQATELQHKFEQYPDVELTY